MDFLEEDILAHGGVPEMGRTGHSILKRDIKELNAIIGGELSGHICYGREYYTIDDPFYCALKVLELMESTASCRGLFDGFPEIFATAEIKAPVPEQDKFRVVAELVESFRATHDVIDVDGVRVRFEDGWGLVRASNTTANLTVRFEAKSLDGVERIRGVFLKHLSMHPSIDLCEVRTAGVA
jgi:phosphomannomutase/phosphoglucomutase